MDSGAVFDADEKGGGGSVGGRSGGTHQKTPPPPFKASDMEGLRVETWLLEVSQSFCRIAFAQKNSMQLEFGSADCVRVFFFSASH